MNREQAENAGDFLRPQGDSRDAQGARGVSWGLNEARERFQGPRDAQGTRGSRWSKLKARGVSWGLPKESGRFQESRYAQ